MRRVHLFEIEDQPWCPSVVRNATTDFLQFAVHFGDNYEPIVPLFAEALQETGAKRVVDLGAGGGGPWSRLIPALSDYDVSVDVLLTDRYPNLAAFERAHRELGERVTFERNPVDATAVPESLVGFQTMFSVFHHYQPDVAREVLADAVKQRQPIAIFEATKRSFAAVLAMLVLTPVLVLLATPFISPVRLSRFLLTYIIPVLPLVIVWDGIVSCLRTYSPDELEELVRSVPDHESYDWSIGEAPGKGPIPVTYLIGTPRPAA